MAPVLGWIVLALLGSAAVLVVASVAGGTQSGFSQLLADLRSGRRRGAAATAGSPEGPAEAPGDDLARPDGAVLPARGAAAAFRGVLSEVPGPREASVDEIFTIGSTDGPAYLDAEELSRTLSRATHRAVRGVQHFTRR
ncbi:hypothetical protein [Actinotalea sp. K2]|uniref:hypothetical protein n=1 Tax=Actinotalea sp. K2 TaxID=2939438 RepID=UPI00201729CA|nr:hypothetical protein [Actinotalea sp. K2]MCL3860253.1 hypothetical protein [Actinotalea sp. K2]